MEAYLIGTGHALPAQVVNNDHFIATGRVTREWILERTGIVERRRADASEPASMLGADASRKAMAAAGVTAADIDIIICTTVTPEQLLPSTACQIQAHLGATKAAAFDVSAACSGFLYGLFTAQQFIHASPTPKTILLASVDYITRMVSHSDVKTSVLFGDGAAAVVLRGGGSGPRVIDVEVGSDGASAELLYIPAGGSREPPSAENIGSGRTSVHMNGPALFKLAVSRMVSCSLAMLAKHGLTVADIDVFVPHQANRRIVDAVGERLDMPPEKVVTNIETVGNTASASIPCALDEAVRDGRIKSGDMVLMVAFGGGLTWGAALLQW